MSRKKRKKPKTTIEVQFPNCRRAIRVTFDEDASPFEPTAEAMLRHFRGTPWVLRINSKDYNVSSVTDKGINATLYPGDDPTPQEEEVCKKIFFDFKWSGIWEIHVY